jgi:uncharacterized protein
MPANASPEYCHAEKKFSEAVTDEERLVAMEEMLKFVPQHKSAEALRANLRTRYKKFKEKIIKQKKSGKSSQQGIKKADMQAILVGPPNSGKSAIFEILTHQKTLITTHPHATTSPILGTINYEDVKIQLIDTPSFPNTDKGILHTADTILLVLDNLEQIGESIKELGKTNAKIILLFSKIDLLTIEEKRKLEANLRSKFKKYDFSFFSIYETKDSIERLKQKIFQTFPIIRVYTKEPKKEHSKEPMILKKGATLENAAEKISKNLKKQTKFAKIWGPSSKFPGQTVGLTHVLKDKDIVEMKI